MKFIKIILSVIIGDLEAFFWVVIGLVVCIGAVNRYWTQKQTDWAEVKAKLTHIQVDERIRNKEKEKYLGLTFEYVVNNKVYQTYSDEQLVTESRAKEQMEELKTTKAQVTIYYQVENPDEVSFEHPETKAYESLRYVLVPANIVVSVLGYLGFKFSRKQF